MICIIRLQNWLTKWLYDSSDINAKIFRKSNVYYLKDGTAHPHLPKRVRKFIDRYIWELDETDFKNRLNKIL